MAEPLAGFLQQILRDGDVDQRRVDVPVTQIGREEVQPVLRVDAGSIPFKDPVHDHRVPQVMHARPRPPGRRLEPSAAHDVGDHRGDRLRGVVAFEVALPEQR